MILSDIKWYGECGAKVSYWEEWTPVFAQFLNPLTSNQKVNLAIQCQSDELVQNS